MTPSSGASDNSAMELRVSRLPFSLDPLIAEAKRRAKQRRLLISLFVVAVAATPAALALGSGGGGSHSGGLSGRLGSQPPAGRPASTAELRQMTTFVVYPQVRGGLLGAAWVSSTHQDIGLTLLYPGRWLREVQPGSRPMPWGELTTISPKLLPKVAHPIAAYLVRLPSGHRNGGLLAQTLLRGPNVLRSELANFCALGKRVAPALTASTCHPAG